MVSCKSPTLLCSSVGRTEGTEPTFWFQSEPSPTQKNGTRVRLRGLTEGNCRTGSVSEFTKKDESPEKTEMTHRVDNMLALVNRRSGTNIITGLLLPVLFILSTQSSWWLHTPGHWWVLDLHTDGHSHSFWTRGPPGRGPSSEWTTIWHLFPPTSPGDSPRGFCSGYRHPQSLGVWGTDLSVPPWNHVGSERLLCEVLVTFDLNQKSWNRLPVVRVDGSPWRPVTQEQPSERSNVVCRLHPAQTYKIP